MLYSIGRAEYMFKNIGLKYNNELNFLRSWQKGLTQQDISLCRYNKCYSFTEYNL